MTSIKRLRSVVQSTAHHGISGLCYVHPHLGIACKDAGYLDMPVNLINRGYGRHLSSETKELALSTTALREFFADLLAREKLDVAGLKTADIIFFFHRGKWPNAAVVKAITTEDKTVECCVDSAGKKGEIL